MLDFLRPKKVDRGPYIYEDYPRVTRNKATCRFYYLEHQPSATFLENYESK